MPDLAPPHPDLAPGSLWLSVEHNEYVYHVWDGKWIEVHRTSVPDDCCGTGWRIFPLQGRAIRCEGCPRCVNG